MSVSDWYRTSDEANLRRENQRLRDELATLREEMARVVQMVTGAQAPASTPSGGPDDGAAPDPLGR